MSDGSSIYEEIDVRTVINGVGTHTRIGGSLIREEALEAMQQAAQNFVYLPDLQAQASELISDVTGADAGYVTSGAASALTLATAAVIAGDDFGIMNQLPNTTDVSSEVLIPRAQRNEYEVALRAGGADLIDVGLNDNHDGKESLKPWEIEEAITEDTVAFAFFERPVYELSLESVVEVTQEYDIPVIVDAAAELPPPENLKRFIDAGASAVAYSGGKAIRGPQTTGILAGREEIIRSAAVQHLPSDTHPEFWNPPKSLIDTSQLPSGLPNHAIGRPMKVGKEELVGLIRALECFLKEDWDLQFDNILSRARNIHRALKQTDGLNPTVKNDDPGSKRSTPKVVVNIDRSASMEAAELVDALRSENPRIFVEERDVDVGRFSINPIFLTDSEANYLCERIQARFLSS